MKSLSLNRPHAIFMVGVPGSGKTHFAKQFAEMFNAPYIDSRSIALHTSTPEEAETIALDFANEIAKTKQTFIYEGAGHDTYTKRADFTRWAKSRGYEPLLIWVQTDQRTAMSRSLKAYELTKESYEQLIKRFSPPHPSESPIVLSGKHTYAAQAKVVLSRLSQASRREVPASIAPDRKPHVQSQQQPERRSITIN